MGAAYFKPAIESRAFQPPRERDARAVPKDATEYVITGLHSKIPILIKRTETRNRPWLFVFHGSGEDAVSSFRNYGRTLQSRLDVNIVIPEYPSYGRSTRKDDEYDEEAPSEDGACQMAVLAHAFVTRKFDVHENDIILLGISIGGGVAADLASRGGVAAVILQSTFVSCVRVYTWTPWSCACDPFQTGDKMHRIARECKGVLILHGESDTLVKVEHAHELAKRMQDSDGVRLCTFPNREHGDLFKDSSYFGIVREFIDSHTLSSRFEINAGAGAGAGAGLEMTQGESEGPTMRIQPEMSGKTE